MARKISDKLILHAKRLIESGWMLKDAASEINVGPATLSRHLRNKGVIIKHVTPAGLNKIDLPIHDIKTMYENGISENAIAKHYGVNRGTIRKHLLKAVKLRTQSEAEKLKWAQMTDEQRANQVEAAHKACAGRVRSLQELKTAAITNQNKFADSRIGIGELEFCQFLLKRGVDFHYQYAIDTYNLDFLIGNVAVELTADRSRTLKNGKHIKRVKHLIERNMNVVYIWMNHIDALMANADNIIADINSINWAKPIASQYRVIRCRRQDYAIIKNERNQFTRIDAPVQFIYKSSIVYFD